MKPDRTQNIFGVERTLTHFHTRALVDLYQFYDKEADLWYTFLGSCLSRDSAKPLKYVGAQKTKRTEL